MLKSWTMGIAFSASVMWPCVGWSEGGKTISSGQKISQDNEWKISIEEISDENFEAKTPMSLEAANCSTETVVDEDFDKSAPPIELPVPIPNHSTIRNHAGEFEPTMPNGPGDLLPGGGLGGGSSFINPLDPLEVIVYSIVNIGETVWNLIERGKPVVVQKYDVATALPQGIKCWADLEGWDRPTSKLFKATFTNKMGRSPVKMSYRIIYLAGGSVDGVGKYIGFATMQPVSVEVGWGYNFGVQATVPSVYNMGTKAEPVGAMQMSLLYSIESSFGHTTESHQFLINGDGLFEKIKDEQ